MTAERRKMKSRTKRKEKLFQVKISFRISYIVNGGAQNTDDLLFHFHSFTYVDDIKWLHILWCK